VNTSEKRNQFFCIFFLPPVATVCYLVTMKTKAARDRYRKISVSLPADMVAWLARSARQSRLSFSANLRMKLAPTFEARHK
jgi:hypothetical protein